MNYCAAEFSDKPNIQKRWLMQDEAEENDAVPAALRRCRTLNFYSSDAPTITARNVVVLCKATVLHRKYIDRFSPTFANEKVAAHYLVFQD